MKNKDLIKLLKQYEPEREVDILWEDPNSYDDKYRKVYFRINTFETVDFIIETGKNGNPIIPKVTRDNLIFKLEKL